MLTAAEQRERQAVVEDVVGTHRAEGLDFDQTVMELMDSFVAGDLTRQELLTAMDDHAKELLKRRGRLTNAAA